jgi:Domain of unknown function (DUF6265)
MAGQPDQPISAIIDEMTWLTGRWVGTHQADTIEENWSAPAGGAMMGMFRALRDGAPRFYELITLDAEGAGLVCRFKHFDRDLTSWEEKDAPLTLDLVGLRADGAVFLRRGSRRWMTYGRDGADRITVFFQSEGETHDPEDEYRFARG